MILSLQSGKMMWYEANLVSVIMPAYNGERFIQQAIESMLAQTYSDWELIIIDDGSTDSTAQIVSSFQDQRLVYVYQENRGQAAALNRGLDVARGEYITTLDVDDWYVPNSLQDRVVFLDQHPNCDVVYGDGVFCDADGNKLQYFSEMRLGNVTGDVFDVLISNSFYGTGASVMIRAQALQKHGIRYDESIVWCQDYDIYLRLAEKCQFGYVDSLTVWYRLHNANMTMTMPAGHKRESLVRTKFKALDSPRFESVQEIYRYSFFCYLLIYDLDNHIEEQFALLEHREFLRLPRQDRAKLIRLLASGYLAIPKRLDEVRLLLMRSLRLNPLDLKTFFLVFLAYYRGGPVAPVFHYWQAAKLRRNIQLNPFAHIKE